MSTVSATSPRWTVVPLLEVVEEEADDVVAEDEELPAERELTVPSTALFTSLSMVSF